MVMLKFEFPILRRLNRLIFLHAIAFPAAISLPACKEREPQPTHPGDIGDDRVLLPPPGAWHDPAVVKGQADWHPFKKIEPAGTEKSADEKPAGREGAAAKHLDPAIEKEIRDLLADYNALITKENYKEASAFFIKGQADTVAQLAEQLPNVATKLKDLAAALPERKETIEKLADELAPKNALKLDLAALSTGNDKEAAGTLSRVPPLSILPESPAPAELPRDIRFVVEGDVWSIDWPVVAKVQKGASRLSEWLGELDAVIADAKSGKVTVETLKDRLPNLAANLEGDKSAKPDSDETAQKPDQPEKKDSD